MRPLPLNLRDTYGHVRMAIYSAGLDVEIRSADHLPNGMMGCYSERTRTILIDRCLPYVAKRCTLVHELVHWSHGDDRCGLHEMRTLYMPLIVADTLAPILKRRKRGERVFSDSSGCPIREQSASAVKGNRTWWPSALKRLGWDTDDWPSPHDLRHTAASLMVRAGANVKAVQRQLGHKSAAMTLDVYADLFDDDLDELSERMGEMLARENVGKMWAKKQNHEPRRHAEI